MLLRPAFGNAKVVYVTTIAGLPQRSALESFSLVDECNRNDLVKVLANACKLSLMIARHKPDVVISTGALPGLIALVIAKVIFRKRTIWVDSVANGKEFSMSGRMAKRFSNLWLTQWEDVAQQSGATYLGRVI